VNGLLLEGRYRLLVGALRRLRRSRRGRFVIAVGVGMVATTLAVLAGRHFVTSSWPLSNGSPGVLVTAGLLLILAHTLKALGWGRLFVTGERPRPLALLAGTGAPR
jgi:hypothetical protein